MVDEAGEDDGVEGEEHRGVRARVEELVRGMVDPRELEEDIVHCGRVRGKLNVGEEDSERLVHSQTLKVQVGHKGLEHPCIHLLRVRKVLPDLEPHTA